MDLAKKIKLYISLGILLNILFFIGLDYFHYHKNMGFTDYPASYFIKYIILIIGSYIIIYLVGKVVHSAQNRLITERRQAEEKLKRHKESYEQLVEYHPDPIIAFNNGIIYFYNYTSMDLLETSERLAGKSIFDYIDPKDREFVKNRVDMLVENKIDFIEFEDFDVITELGNVKKVECIGISNYIWGKEVVQLVLRDVTEKKKTEELLQKSEKLAVIGQLAAGVAHEIRNPLTSIHGFLKVIYSQIDSEEIKEFIKITLKEVNRINSVTNELLFLAKPQKEVIEKINLQNLLKDVIHFIDSEANLKNIIIETSIMNENLEVNGIVNHLKQVFLNVFKNSIDAMPSGGNINLHLGVEDLFVTVKIVDHGVGIPDDRLKHIGEPFYSLKENGTGLGLMITKKIIKEHDGLFEIESMLGVGTTVCIKLPRILE